MNIEWDYYFSLPFWTEKQAVCLLFQCDPNLFKYEWEIQTNRFIIKSKSSRLDNCFDINSKQRLKLIDKIDCIINMIREDIETGKIKPQNSMPDELKTVLNSGGEDDVKIRTLLSEEIEHQRIKFEYRFAVKDFIKWAESKENVMIHIDNVEVLKDEYKITVDNFRMTLNQFRILREIAENDLDENTEPFKIKVPVEMKAHLHPPSKRKNLPVESAIGFKRTKDFLVWVKQNNYTGGLTNNNLFKKLKLHNPHLWSRDIETFKVWLKSEHTKDIRHLFNKKRGAPKKI